MKKIHINSGQYVQEERNTLNVTKRRKASLVDHILRSKCVLQHDIERNVKAKTSAFRVEQFKTQ
jgi:hypothetical protein